MTERLSNQDEVTRDILAYHEAGTWQLDELEALMDSITTAYSLTQKLDNDALLNFQTYAHQELSRREEQSATDEPDRLDIDLTKHGASLLQFHRAYQHDDKPEMLEIRENLQLDAASYDLIIHNLEHEVRDFVEAGRPVEELEETGREIYGPNYCSSKLVDESKRRLDFEHIKRLMITVHHDPAVYEQRAEHQVWIARIAESVTMFDETIHLLPFIDTDRAAWLYGDMLAQHEDALPLDQLSPAIASLPVLFQRDADAALHVGATGLMHPDSEVREHVLTVLAGVASELHSQLSDQQANVLRVMIDDFSGVGKRPDNT